MALEFNSIFSPSLDEGKRPSKELYLSLSHADFQTISPDTDQVQRNLVKLDVDVVPGQIFAGVHLPHNATITGMIWYGNIDALNDPWGLVKAMQFSVPGAGNTVTPSVHVNTYIDSNQAYAVVNNLDYYYICYIYGLGVNVTDEVYGAVITYTI